MLIATTERSERVLRAEAVWLQGYAHRLGRLLRSRLPLEPPRAPPARREVRPLLPGHRGMLPGHPCSDPGADVPVRVSPGLTSSTAPLRQKSELLALPFPLRHTMYRRAIADKRPDCGPPRHRAIAGRSPLRQSAREPYARLPVPREA